MGISWIIYETIIILCFVIKVLIMIKMKNKIKFYFIIKDILNVILIILLTHNTLD